MLKRIIFLFEKLYYFYLFVLEINYFIDFDCKQMLKDYIYNSVSHRTYCKNGGKTFISLVFIFFKSDIL